MADYAVGGIKFDFLTNDSSNVVTKLKDVTKALNSMGKAINNFPNNFSALDNFSNALDNFSKITNITKPLKQFTNNLNALSKVDLTVLKNNLKELSSIDMQSVARSFAPLNALNPKVLSSFNSAIRNIQKIGNDKVPFDNITTNFQRLADAVEPFIAKLREARPELEALSSALDLGRLNYKFKQLEARAKQSANTIKKHFSLQNIFSFIGRITALLNYFRGLTNTISSSLSNVIDFEETLNKFQVSFGNLSGEATTFVNKLSNAFNLSRESIMNYMSTFNNMLKSLGGVSADQTFGLSKTLTQLAIDYASLMNTSIDKAMQQFQSVLAGQTKAIRTTSGVDVTDNTIFEMYKALGGTKTIRQLTQTEKRLLRILAVEKQLASLGAVGLVDEKTMGDFEKTLNSTANNLKRISQTFEELKVYVGAILKYYFQPLIEKVLSFLLVIKEITKSFAILNNFTIDEFGSKTAGIFDEMNDSIDETEEKLNGLLSFDKFEVLSKGSDEDTDSVQKIIDEIKEYQTAFDQVKNNANEIASQILTSLGYVSQIYEYVDSNGQIVKDTIYALQNEDSIVSKLKKAIEKVKGFLEKVKVVINKIVDLILKPAFLKTIDFVGKVLEKIEPYLEDILDIVDELITKSADSLNDLTTNDLNNVFIIIKAIADILPTILIILRTLIDPIASLIKLFASVSEFLGIILEKVANLLSPAVITIISAIGVMVSWVVGVVEKLASLLTRIFRTIINFFKGDFQSIPDIWKDFGESFNDMTNKFSKTLDELSSKVRSSWANSYWGSLFGSSSEPRSLLNGYASGGLPAKGQMFIANEKGPELVANIGGRTAVANNDMIVQAIEQASYRGIVRGMSISSNKQDINIDLRGFNADEVARAIYTPLMREFKRNGINIQGA